MEELEQLNQAMRDRDKLKDILNTMMPHTIFMRGLQRQRLMLILIYKQQDHIKLHWVKRNDFQSF
jgi:hypothetical protein